MEQIGIGLIGCGGMGRGLAEALAEVEGSALLAVSDVDEKIRTDAAEKFSVPGYADYSELLQHTGLDAVIVATPGFLHREPTLAAAAAGKHVFSEKPMATSVADCDQMIAACEVGGVRLMIGQVLRYHHVQRKIKELVASGEYGQPACAVMRRLGGPWSPQYARPWRLSLEQSGGALLEINAHEIDFLRWVLGEVVEVTARGGHYVQEATDYPDVALVLLQFQSGAVAHLHSSMASAAGEYSGRFDLTGGSLVAPAFWGADAGLRCTRFGQEPVFLPVSELTGKNPVAAELEEFVTAIRDRRPPAVSGHDGRTTVAIGLAAYESIATGKPVGLA